jgi:hypothetical protein
MLHDVDVVVVAVFVIIEGGWLMTMKHDLGSLLRRQYLLENFYNIKNKPTTTESLARARPSPTVTQFWLGFSRA